MITKTVLIIVLTIVGKHDGVQCDDFIDNYLSLSSLEFPDKADYLEWIMVLMTKGPRKILESRLWCEIEIFAKDNEISIQTPSKEESIPMKNEKKKELVIAASNVMHDILANIFKGILHALQTLCKMIIEKNKQQQSAIEIQKKIFKKIYYTAIITAKIVNTLEVNKLNEDLSLEPFFTNEQLLQLSNRLLKKYDNFKAFVPSFTPMWKFVISKSDCRVPDKLLALMSELNTEGRLIKYNDNNMQVKSPMFERQIHVMGSTNDVEKQTILNDNSVTFLLELYTWLILLGKCGTNMMNDDEIKKLRRQKCTGRPTVFRKCLVIWKMVSMLLKRIWRK